MYCTSCGRDNETSPCLHVNSFTQKDQLFMLVLLIAIPTTIYGIYYNILFDYALIDYLKVGSISISIILIVMLLAYYFFHKLYIAIFFGCHQKTKRSFHFNGKPYVLCARCTGLMVGMFLSIIITMFDFSYWWIMLGTIPLIIDGVVQRRTSYVSNNLKRIITGILAGPSIVLIFGWIHFIISRFMVNTVLELL